MLSICMVISIHDLTPFRRLRNLSARKPEVTMNRRLLGLTTILTLLALPPSQSAWPSATVDELMRRHLEALGGAEAVQSIRSVISTSEIEMWVSASKEP